jgi:hypothetical protein
MKCNIHRKTKIRLYKTLIRTLLTYDYKTQSLSKKSENAINIFKRKMLRWIYAPVEEYGQWRFTHDKKLYDVYKQLDLLSFIKLKTLQSARNVWLPLDSIPQKALRATLTRNRPVGKPRKGRKDAVTEDAASLLQCRNWKLTAQNRNVWRQKLQEAKPRISAVVP